MLDAMGPDPGATSIRTILNAIGMRPSGAVHFAELAGRLADLRDLSADELVFSAVPLALTGGVAALWLRDTTFSIRRRSGSSSCPASPSSMDWRC
jgi:hypothetical protein